MLGPESLLARSTRSVENPFDHVFQPFIRAYSYSVGQRRREQAHLVESDVVPYREYDFPSVYFASRQAIQLLLRPMFLKEVWAENYNSKS